MTFQSENSYLYRTQRSGKDQDWIRWVVQKWIYFRSVYILQRLTGNTNTIISSEHQVPVAILKMCQLKSYDSMKETYMSPSIHAPEVNQINSCEKSKGTNPKPVYTSKTV